MYKYGYRRLEDIFNKDPYCWKFPEMKDSRIFTGSGILLHIPSTLIINKYVQCMIKELGKEEISEYPKFGLILVSSIFDVYLNK